MSEGNIRLFFVGRSGNGVTSTITSLLSDNSSLEPVTASNSKLYQIYKVGVFVAVDGSGIGDSGGDMKHSDEKVKQSISCILEEIGEDFEALVCVFKYGVRFTKQEKDAVDKIKQYFGKNIFMEKGVIVLTYGDNFDKENNQSFKEWCDKQTGHFQELLSTCNGRIVLFNNRETDVNQINKQREQIKQAVQNLSTMKSDTKSSVPALPHEQAERLYPALYTGQTEENSVRPSKTEPTDVTKNDGDLISNSSTQQLVPEGEPSSNVMAGMAKTSHVINDVQEESKTRYEESRDPESQRRYEDSRDPESQRCQNHWDPESQRRHEDRMDPMQAMLVEIKTGNRRILWCLSFVIFVICGIGAVVCLKLFHVI